MNRCAVVYGQFGAAADPLNLPAFRNRLAEAGVNTILIQHTDSKSAYDFLHGFDGRIAIIGASLGAMSAVVFAGYLNPQEVDFVGGFQPSDYDPSGHEVAIQDEGDLITRAITVPRNVKQALCFRNPIVAATGGLGHATYVLDSNNTTTKLTVVNRVSPHPDDFGRSADEMYAAAMAVLR